ncbi:MAG: MjaI family restriction endonuclease [Erysipelotrichaceae bacterium]
MMKFEYTLSEVVEAYEDKVFDTHVRPLLNLAGQTSQATRKKHVGQLSEEFKNFKENSKVVDLPGWKSYHKRKFPKAVKDATDLILKYTDTFKDALNSIDRSKIESWVEELLYDKTYSGMMIQEFIIKLIAENNDKVYRKSNPEEEIKGIDGYVGEIPYSVKPESYKNHEKKQSFGIEGLKMIYYKKTKSKWVFDVED